MTFNEVLVNYKIYASRKHKKQAYNNLIYNFNFRVLSYFNNVDIYSLTKQDIIDWKNYIYSFNYSNSYNDDLFYIFNDFLNYCCEYYSLEHNYLKDVGSFVHRVEFHKSDFYTLNEFKSFINNVDNLVYKSYFILMFFTGCRPSEAMALNFNDFDGKYIFINKSIERRGNRDICSTKNQYSIRKVIANKYVIKYINLLKKYYINKYSNFNYNYFIFGGIKPLSPTTIDRYKSLACTKAHIKCITQHQFRHSYATYLINNNIPLNVVSKLLGHSNVETTSRIYIHNNLEQEKRVLKTLNSYKFLGLQ